jgi:CelD/BcsL family acetyltransferase involved in cellulose biosynthesis
MAELRTRRRLHRVPDLRLARGVATKRRSAPRRPPVIVIGRYGDGDIAFLLPLCVVPRRLTRRLCWLGQELCDYNAPLLARDFSERVTPERFLAAWQELQAQIQCEPSLRHDWIEFEKMPQKIGGQTIRSSISESHPTPAARI